MHAKKQENMMHKKKKNQAIETNSEMTCRTKQQKRTFIRYKNIYTISLTSKGIYDHNEKNESYKDTNGTSKF